MSRPWVFLLSLFDNTHTRIHAHKPHINDKGHFTLDTKILFCTFSVKPIVRFGSSEGIISNGSLKCALSDSLLMKPMCVVLYSTTVKKVKDSKMVNVIIWKMKTNKHGVSFKIFVNTCDQYLE